MANKFNILGVFDHYEDNQLIVNVRRNYRNYDSEYDVDKMRVSCGLSLSVTMLESLKDHDVIVINGRIENNEYKELILIAEHIVRLKDLHSLKS